jgi:hypothetical protein
MSSKLPESPARSAAPTMFAGRRRKGCFRVLRVCSVAGRSGAEAAGRVFIATRRLPKTYISEMKVTRRAAARILAATAAVPAAAVPQADSSEPAKTARDQFQKSAQQMADVKIPVATEPPFHFRP